MEEFDNYLSRPIFAIISLSLSLVFFFLSLSQLFFNFSFKFPTGHFFGTETCNMKFETRVSNLENERKVRQIERQHSCWKAFNQIKQKELSKLKRELEKKQKERDRKTIPIEQSQWLIVVSCVLELARGQFAPPTPFSELTSPRGSL